MTAFSRADILRAFGVTEDDLAAVDDGYIEARREAEKERARFAEHIAARAQDVADLLVAGEFKDAAALGLSVEYEMSDLLAQVKEPPL